MVKQKPNMEDWDAPTNLEPILKPLDWREKKRRGEIK